MIIMFLGAGVFGAGLIGGVYSWMYSLCHCRWLAVILTAGVLIGMVLLFMVLRKIYAHGVSDLQQALDSAF